MAVSGAEVEQVILGLLERRAPGKTICPSDAARALDAEDWRALLAPCASRQARWSPTDVSR